jgi:ferritin-like protein
MSSENLHVPRETLTREARLLHYAITSLKEELDAVDWYRQRADDTEDAELKQVLLHNMREEMEHAAMLIEWLRRNNTDFEGHLRTYLFTEGSLLEVEEGATGKAPPSGGKPGNGPGGGPGGGPGKGGGFTIGSLKNRP